MRHFPSAPHRSRRDPRMCVFLWAFILCAFFVQAAQAADHWIETAPDTDVELTIIPSDPSSHGLKRGTEVCRLPAGKRIALYDAPRTLPLEPDYLHVTLEEPLDGDCALLDGWVFRAHVKANSEETNRAGAFHLRTKAGAKLRTGDGSVPRCELPADALLALSAAPTWSSVVPGGVDVKLLNNVLGCDATSGVVLSGDLNLFDSTFPHRKAVGASPDTDPMHWFTTGERKLALRIRADVSESDLEPRTGKCVLPPRTRFALAREPGSANATTFQVLLAAPLPDCAFTFGYVDRSGVKAVSSVGGLSQSDDASVRADAPGDWIQVGAAGDTWLTIRTDAPASGLPKGTGRCALKAGSRYWLARAPGHRDDTHVQVLFQEPVHGCGFLFGYVARGDLAATSRLTGEAPRTPSGLALARIAEAAQGMEGRGVFELGCPQSYRRGTGSVCCARMVSQALAKAGVAFTASDAVVVLVANLKKKGWVQVPIEEAPRGAIVFHDKTPGVHGEQHVGICSTPGCTRAWNSWQQRFSNNGYPSLPSFAPTLAKGGAWGGALVPRL